MRTYNGVASIKISDSTENFYAIGGEVAIIVTDPGGKTYTLITVHGGNGGAYGVDVEVDTGRPLSELPE